MVVAMPEFEVPVEEDVAPAMPDVTAVRYGYYHTADSALASLAKLGIAPERITIKKAGRGWAAGRVVEQQPSAGTPLKRNTTIELAVEGDGLFAYLPVGLREGTKDGEIGTQELVSLFDDPLEKAAYFVRQGGRYFDVRAGNQTGCARWIRLFGVEPDEWPAEQWFRLALLLPRLHRLAGREEGLRLAARLLLELDIAALRWRLRFTLLAAKEQSLLGAQSSSLGVDLIMGEGLEDEVALELTFGPVGLDTYYLYQSDVGQQYIHQVLRLVLPFHLIYDVQWLVKDSNRAPRLGNAADNAVLGVNSHMGFI